MRLFAAAAALVPTVGIIQHFTSGVLGDHPGYCGILVRLEVLRLGLLASGHAAGVSAGGAAAFALRDVSAFCRYISEERMNQHTKKVRK